VPKGVLGVALPACKRKPNQGNGGSRGVRQVVDRVGHDGNTACDHTDKDFYKAKNNIQQNSDHTRKSAA
jgi:hypothetical protein